MTKRIFDILAAATGLIVLAPVLLLIALAVAVSSGWPVFFRQVRVGRGGAEFRLVKFRTMSVLKSAEQGAFEAGSVRRVTALGRILRKTKMDELPQLWNVLVGEMALVGPRPEVRQWVGVYPERWARVHSVRPGITDPASIEFRDEEEILARSADPTRLYREEILPRKLECYERYVQSRSFWGDIRILFRTVWVVVVRAESAK